MTDEEVREEMPVFWAAKEVATLIGDAPWDSLPSASPKRQPLTDEQISWLIDHNGLELLFEAYFSPKTTCPTCASLARAVLMDQAGKA